MLKLIKPLFSIIPLKALLCIAFSFLIGTAAIAQKKYTISGTVKDAATGEVLIGATIQFKQIVQNGAISNSYGFYSLSAPAGEYDLLVTYVGYAAFVQHIILHGNVALSVMLTPKSDLNEVVVNGKGRSNENVASAQMVISKPVDGFSQLKLARGPVILSAFSL